MNHTEDEPPRQTDHERIRRFIRAVMIVDEARRMDDYRAEVRATTPASQYWPGGVRLFASDLARMVPKEFGSREEIEAIALEFAVGSDGATKLAAIETVARQVLEDRNAKPVKPVEEPQESPPEPPADWRSTVQGQGPIVVTSAADVPDSVKLARRLAQAKGRK